MAEKNPNLPEEEDNTFYQITGKIKKEPPKGPIIGTITDEDDNQTEVDNNRIVGMHIEDPGKQVAKRLFDISEKHGIALRVTDTQGKTEIGYIKTRYDHPGVYEIFSELDH